VKETNLKEIWLKIKEWWFSLALREKQAVVLGGTVAALFIVYQFIWSPLIQRTDTMRKRIVAQEKTLLWMQGADKEIEKLASQQSNGGYKALSVVVLLSLMQKQVNHAGLEQQLTQLKQASNESVEMHFQKIDFDKLIAMLMKVVKEERISIAQLSVKAEDTPGIVNADVILKIK
jgi:general secretion pathway protein M